MNINNPQTFDYIKEANGDSMKMKLVPIGTWDMDTGVDVVNVAHGLTFANITHCEVYIINDAGTYLYNFISPDTGTFDVAGVIGIGAANIDLSIPAAGYYHQPDFGGAGNRGFIKLWYKG